MEELRLVTEDGREVPLRRGTMTLGRGTDNEVVLRGTPLSRRHAEIRFDGQDWLLVDLGSTNGTSVDGQPLEPHRPYRLQPDSIVQMGGQRVFRVEMAYAAAVPFFDDDDDFAVAGAGPRSGGISPWVFVLAGVAAVLLVGLGILVVLLLPDSGEGAGSAEEGPAVAAGASETPPAVVVALPSPGADEGAGEGGPIPPAPVPGVTVSLAVAPEVPAGGGSAGGGSGQASQPGGGGQVVPPIGLMPTLSGLATLLAPQLPGGTPGALPGDARYPAPTLVSPENGASLQGAGTMILLTWTSVGELAEDEYYSVSVRYGQRGQVGYAGGWVKATEWRLPEWLFGQADQGRFEWDVTVRQATRVRADGGKEGPALSPKSETWTFTWTEGGQPPPPPQETEPPPPPPPPVVDPTPTFSK